MCLTEPSFIADSTFIYGFAAFAQRTLIFNAAPPYSDDHAARHLIEAEGSRRARKFAHAAGQVPGCGTVFSLDPNTGAETVLHSFGAGTSTGGLEPVSGLLAVNGTLYGTTQSGGANNNGAVFALLKKR